MLRFGTTGSANRPSTLRRLTLVTATVTVKNVSDAAVFNPLVQAGDSDADEFIFEPGHAVRIKPPPDEQFKTSPIEVVNGPVLHAGASVSKDIVYVPKYKGPLADMKITQPGMSGPKVTFASRAAPDPATVPKLDIVDIGVTNVTLEFDAVPGAVSYDVYHTTVFEPFGGKTINIAAGTCTPKCTTVFGGNYYDQRIVAVRPVMANPGPGDKLIHNARLAVLSKHPPAPPDDDDPGAGDPVVVGTGSLYDEHTDIPSNLYGMAVTRAHMSMDDSSTLLGPRWTPPHHQRLVGSASGNRILIDSRGGQHEFIRLPDGSLRRPAELFATLAEGPDDTATVEFSHKERWTFDRYGYISAMYDGLAQTVTIERDVAHSPTRVAHSNGQTITYTYTTQGLLGSATAADGRTVSYTYDDNDHLRSVTRIDGRVETYETDDDGRVLRVLDPGGRVALAMEYYPDGRARRQVDANGAATSFEFDDAAPATRVTFENSGDTLVYSYDDNGRLASITDPYGKRSDRVFDAAGQLIATTDRNGNDHYQDFDDNGNRTTFRRPDGRGETATWDADSRITSSTDAAGRTTTYSYAGDNRMPATVTAPEGTTTLESASGLLTRRTDPGGQVTSYTYDADRNITSITTPAGTATATWDNAGFPATVTDQAGATTTYTHDVAGRPLTVTDATGATTTYGYDAIGNLTTETDATGATTTHAYDNARNRVTTTDPLGRTTRTVLLEDGRIDQTIAPDGSATHYSYGPLRRLTATTDPTGRTTSYQHDNMGRVTAVIDPAGARTTTTYDTLGRPVTVTDPLGRVTRSVYDPLGRTVETIDPAGGSTRSTFDSAGNLIATTDPTGAVTRYQYNAAGLPITRTDALGNVTTITYDPAGRPIAETDPLGGVTRTEYDAAGNVAATVTPAGRRTTYEHDVLGRLTATVDPLGGRTTTTYSARGETLTQADPTGGVTANTYDGAGQLTAVTDPNGGITRFTYDALGQRATRTNALGNTERWAYDPAGRQLSYTNQTFHQWTTTYDGVGRPATTTDPTSRTAAYAYDAAGQVVSTTYAGGGQPSFAVTATYDALGRRTSMTDQLGTTTTGYDANGRITEFNNPIGVGLRFGYDANGNRTRLNAFGDPANPASGIDLTYAYDAGDRMTRIGPADSNHFTYTWDPDGHLLSEDAQGQLVGDRRSWTYDAAGRQSGFDQTLNGRRYRRTLQRDAAGRIVSSGRPNDPTPQEQFAYDQAGQLVAWSKNNRDTSYEYDAIGQRVAVTQPNGNTTRYTHDASGQLINETKRRRVTDYTYDDAGRQTGSDDRRGNTQSIAYDARGLPATLTDTMPEGTRTETRVYDGDGRLTGTGGTYPDGTEKNHVLLWDITEEDGGQVLADISPETTTSAGAISVFGYGAAGRLAFGQIKATDPATAELVQFALNEFEDTVGAVSTPIISGQIPGLQLDLDIANRADTDRYVRSRDYDPFGNPVRGTTTEQDNGLSFGYRSEMHIGNRIHLRNRDYDPRLARFLTRDSINGRSGSTALTNPYQYASNDPVNRHDPLGLSDEIIEPDPGLTDCINAEAENRGGADEYHYFTDPVTSNGTGVLQGCIGTWFCTGAAINVAACKISDPIAKIAAFILTILPGYDCVQTLIDFSWGNAAFCAIDFVPGAGKVDEAASVVIKVSRRMLGHADEVTESAARLKKLKKVAAKCVASFGAETPVLMANGAAKPISQIKIGDQVLATDPTTGESGGRTVTSTFPHTDELLTLKTSAGEIVTTEDHKYWNETDGEWQESQELDEGDQLLTADGDQVTVEGLDWSSVHTDDAYDLSVADLHTYYVGAGDEAVLVHNCFDLDALSASGRAADKGGLTRAGRAYQKHMGRGELPQVGGAQLDEVGQNLLDDILTAPGTRIEQVTSGNFKGGVRYIRPDGTGATFDASGNLQYFGVGY